MNPWFRPAFPFLPVLLAISCVAPAPTPPEPSFSEADFDALLQIVANGWNSNDALLAASAFAEDAVYAEPPEKQLYVGRRAIYEFFGGPEGRDSWMRMTWHQTSFNESRQVGAGEFTFEWEGGQVHGMVSIKVSDGLIHRWREYFYESDLRWKDFQERSEF